MSNPNLVPTPGIDVNGHAYVRNKNPDKGVAAGALGARSLSVSAPTAPTALLDEEHVEKMRPAREVIKDFRSAIRGETDEFEGIVNTIRVPTSDLRALKGSDAVVHGDDVVSMPVAEMRALIRDFESQPLTQVQVPEPAESKVLDTRITEFDGYGRRPWYGSKYDGSRYVHAKEIAKNLRGDIAALVKANELPGKADGFIYSVRARTYTGGQAVDIDITHTSATGEFDSTWAENPDYDPESRDFGRDRNSRWRPEVNAAIKLLTAAADQYRRDNSDSMTDYFDVNFYGSVSVRGRKPKAQS